MGNQRYEAQRKENYDLRDNQYFIEFISYNPLKLSLNDEDKVNVFIIHLAKHMKVIDIKEMMGRTFITVDPLKTIDIIKLDDRNLRRRRLHRNI